MVRWKNMGTYIFRQTSYSKTCILELQILHHMVECFFPLPPLYKCLILFFPHTIMCDQKHILLDPQITISFLQVKEVQ